MRIDAFKEGALLNEALRFDIGFDLLLLTS